MSPLLEEMRRLRRAPVAVLHQFGLKYKRECLDLYAFVEGYGDREYYEPLFVQLAAPNVYFFPCDGKDGVLRALGTLGAHEGRARLFFFIDKDLDDFIGRVIPEHPALFQTEFYSIENYLVDETTFGIAISSLLQLHHDDPRVSHSVDLYRALHKRFIRVLRCFFAWVICARRAGLTVTLNNVRLERIFAIDGNLRLRTSRHNIRIECARMAAVSGNEVGDAEVSTQFEALSVDEYKCWLRGKFDLWLFVRAFSVVHKALCGEASTGTRKIPATIQLTETSAFRALVARVPYPDRLTRFIGTRLELVRA